MNAVNAANRLSIGVPEFDLLLGDGLPRGGTVLVRGGPGSGKTLLGLHFTAAGNAMRENALIISFSDNEAALRSYAHQVRIDITHVQCLDLTPPPGHLAGADCYEIFAPPDVEGGPVSRRIVEAIEHHRPARVFIDGFSLFRYSYPDLYQYRRHLIALMRFLRESGCTAVFSSELSPQFSDDELTFAADGVITLHRQGRLQQLEVDKLRAGGYVPGRHRYELGAGGWQVFPSLDLCGTERIYAPQLASTGFAALDDLLGGGLVTGSTTLICGVECIGKSLLALALAEKLTASLGKGALLLLDESEALLRRRAATVGLDLRALQDDGRLLVEQAEVDDAPEVLLQRLRVLAEPRRCAFLVVDSLDNFLAREGGEPTAALWRQLVRYAARRGLVLLATWRQVPGDIQPPAGLADTELVLLPAQGGQAPGLRLRHHRHGLPRHDVLRWQLSSTGVHIDVDAQA